MRCCVHGDHGACSRRGVRQAAALIPALGAELRDARLSLNLSQAAVAEAAGVSHPAIGRIERGASPFVSISRLAVVASILGLRLSIRAYPVGAPLRDAAQIGLLGRLRAVPAPVADLAFGGPDPREGDLRAWDASISGAGWTAYVDAETRIRDAQALERRTNLKRRDTTDATGSSCCSPTPDRTGRWCERSGRRSSTTRSTRARSFDALAAGQDPGGSGVVLL